MAEHEERLTAREARQGFLDRPVLMVLVVGMVLVITGFALLMLWPARQANSAPALEKPCAASAQLPSMQAARVET